MSSIAIALVTCELRREDEEWVEPTTLGLSIFSLVLSCIFLLELLLSLWVEGLRYGSLPQPETLRQRQMLTLPQISVQLVADV